MSLSRLADSATVLSLHDSLARAPIPVFSTAMMITSRGALLVIAALIGGRVVGEWVLEDLPDLVIVGWGKVLSAASLRCQIAKDISFVHFSGELSSLRRPDVAFFSLRLSCGDCRGSCSS